MFELSARDLPSTRDDDPSNNPARHARLMSTAAMDAIHQGTVSRRIIAYRSHDRIHSIDVITSH